jgi:hypothetical protein
MVLDRTAAALYVEAGRQGVSVCPMPIVYASCMRLANRNESTQI